MATNDAPLSPTRDTGPSAQSLSGAQLRAHLADIEAQMAALASQMALLRTEREAVLGDLAAIIYPVHTLPTDIVSEIFRQFVSPLVVQDHPAHGHYPLPLLRICKTWRAIALSTCELWTRFTNDLIRGGRYVGAISRILQDWFGRAGSLPLHLTLIFRSDITETSMWEAVLPILTRYSSQFVSLEFVSFNHFDGPTSWPIARLGPLSSLTKIRIACSHPLDIAPFMAPQLREACFVWAPHARTQIPLPWIQLTTLVLEAIGLAGCFDILQHTSNVETLSASMIVSSSGDIITSPPCVLRHLRTVQLVNHSAHLLNHLILPALTHLKLQGAPKEVAGQVRSTVAGSGCLLRSLHMTFMEIETICAYISSLPSLHHLTLNHPIGDASDFTHLFNSMADDHALLPALESFEIEDSRTLFALQPLSDMLSTRWDGMEGVAKIRSFRCDFRGGVEWELQGTFNKLRHIRGEGFDLQLAGAPKWPTDQINSLTISELDEERNKGFE